MSQSYPLEITREIDARWERRAANSLRVLRNSKPAGAGLCPACNRPAIAPAASEYHGNGRIHHHWRCNACSHEWISVLDLRE